MWVIASRAFASTLTTGRERFCEHFETARVLRGVRLALRTLHDRDVSRKGGRMSTKNDYSPEEWKAITGSPVAAGLLVSLADPSGLVGIAKEAVAVGKAIADSARGNAPEIVKSLAESVKEGGGRPEVPNVQTGDPAKTKDALIGTLKTAVGAVERKSPTEAGAYKSWLTSVATKVSEASREGGFLGVGGTVVSANEQEALKQLAEVLGPNR
jgi:hypothetical protein